ncbi:MAG TPA: hypothetical protein VF881_06285 [Polyangiaceae bacterium]
MTSYLAGLFACVFLFACSPRPKVGLTIYIKPPGSMEVDASAAVDGDAAIDGGTVAQDFSCIGVVGFEITVSSDGDTSQSFALNEDPVLSPERCQLSQPVTIQDLDPEAPATITVAGYDGAHKRLVVGSTTVTNLRGTSATIALGSATAQLIPVVVIDRDPLYVLAGNLSRDEIKSMTLRIKAGGAVLLAVDATASQPFFGVNPAAYAVNNLVADGGSANIAVTVSFVTTTGLATLMTTRTPTLAWRSHYYEIVLQ